MFASQFQFTYRVRVPVSIYLTLFASQFQFTSIMFASQFQFTWASIRVTISIYRNIVRVAISIYLNSVRVPISIYLNSVRVTISIYRNSVRVTISIYRNLSIYLNSVRVAISIYPNLSYWFASQWLSQPQCLCLVFASHFQFTCVRVPIWIYPDSARVPIPIYSLKSRDYSVYCSRKEPFLLEVHSKTIYRVLGNYNRHIRTLWTLF